MAALSPSAGPEPDHAANTDSGTGCLVADANGAYTFDGTCSWHLVFKLDQAGNPQLLRYQDHGTLPEGAPHPKQTRHNALTTDFGGGVVCTGTEVTMPRGEYKSDCHFSS